MPVHNDTIEEHFSSTAQVSPEIRVLIVAASPFSRACIQAGLLEEADLIIEAVGEVGEAASGPAPDLVLFQDHYHDSSEVNMLRQLTQSEVLWPGVATLVITRPGDIARFGEYIRSGARGLLTSDISLASIIDTIRILMSDLSVYPHEVMALLRDSPSPTSRELVEGNVCRQVPVERLGKLTPRQRDVLGLLTLGRSNKAIAHHLRISESTVKVHVRAIMSQTGVANRTQIVAHYLAPAQ